MQCHRHCVWNNALKGVISVPLKPLGASARAGTYQTAVVLVWGRKGLWAANDLRDLLPCAPCHPAGWVTAQHTWLKLLLRTLNSFFFSSWEKQRGIPCCNSLLHRQLLWKCTSIGLWNFLLWETKDSKAWKVKDFQKEQKGGTGMTGVPLEKDNSKQILLTLHACNYSKFQQIRDSVTNLMFL